MHIELEFHLFLIPYGGIASFLLLCDMRVQCLLSLYDAAPSFAPQQEVRQRLANLLVGVPKREFPSLPSLCWLSAGTVGR